MNNIYFIILTGILLLYIIYEVVNKRFSIKESIIWVVLGIIMLILAIFPYIIDNVAKFLNISYPPSLLFVLCILFLIMCNFRHDKIIAEHKEKIKDLAQNVAILKEEVYEMKEKSNEGNRKTKKH